MGKVPTEEDGERIEPTVLRKTFEQSENGSPAVTKIPSNYL